MTKLRLNKLDVARRQVDAAIRMTFNGEDPLATHTVIAAGNRIIRDLCEKRGDIESYLQFTGWICRRLREAILEAVQRVRKFSQARRR